MGNDFFYLGSEVRASQTQARKMIQNKVCNALLNTRMCLINYFLSCKKRFMRCIDDIDSFIRAHLR